MTKALAFASVLSIVAVILHFKSSVSETAAGTPQIGPTISVSDLHRKIDLDAMPVMKLEDETFVFTDNGCRMSLNGSNTSLCTIGSSGDRW
ncbi:MAG TPA: hypothetical protein VGN55_16565 [Xanthobacteraceae bacterium]|jgi:hypothetical protein